MGTAAKLTAAAIRANAAEVTTRWPRRHVVVVLIFLGVIIAYSDRVNISVAAVAMRWLVDVTGTYSAAFVLTAIVSATGALAFGVLADSRPIVERA